MCGQESRHGGVGSSRHLVVGPMSGTAALSAGIVGTFVAAGDNRYAALTTALALVTGVLGVAAGLARLGFLASFISEPVLKGCIVGLALTIVAGQLPKLFGVEGGDGDFFAKLWHLLTSLDHTSRTTLAIGVLSLVVVLGLRRWLPLVPGSLVVVLLGWSTSPPCAGCIVSGPNGSAAFTAPPPARTSSPRSPRCSAYSSSTPCPAW